jgi:hypothetical protein
LSSVPQNAEKKLGIFMLSFLSLSFHNNINYEYEVIFNDTSNVRINVALKRVRVTIVAVEKYLSVSYSEFVSVMLNFEHSIRMRRVILSVACLSGCTIYFHIVSLTARFSGEMLLIIKCILWTKQFKDNTIEGKREKLTENCVDLITMEELETTMKA